MKILITGGTGRVGSAVTEHLIKKNYDVLVIDNKPESTVDAPYKQCDIMNFEAVREHMTGCDAVAHLAAFPSPANAPGQDVFRVNVAGTFNIYEAAATLGIQTHCTSKFCQCVGLLLGQYGTRTSVFTY